MLQTSITTPYFWFPPQSTPYPEPSIAYLDLKRYGYLTQVAGRQLPRLGQPRKPSLTCSMCKKKSEIAVRNYANGVAVSLGISYRIKNQNGPTLSCRGKFHARYESFHCFWTEKRNAILIVTGGMHVEAASTHELAQRWQSQYPLFPPEGIPTLPT